MICWCWPVSKDCWPTCFPSWPKHPVFALSVANEPDAYFAFQLVDWSLALAHSFADAYRTAGFPQLAGWVEESMMSKGSSATPMAPFARPTREWLRAVDPLHCARLRRSAPGANPLASCAGSAQIVRRRPGDIPLPEKLRLSRRIVARRNEPRRREPTERPWPPPPVLRLPEPPSRRCGS